MTFFRSIYVPKVMKLLAFIFEHPSYFYNNANFHANKQFFKATKPHLKGHMITYPYSITLVIISYKKLNSPKARLINFI